MALKVFCTLYDFKDLTGEAISGQINKSDIFDILLLQIFSSHLFEQSQSIPAWTCTTTLTTWGTPHYRGPFHQNSSKLLLVSRSRVRDVSTSSVGRLPSCTPPLQRTFTAPLSLSLSPTTGHEYNDVIISYVNISSRKIASISASTH